MLTVDLCDYSDASIVVKGSTTIDDRDINFRASKNLRFKNNALFSSCSSEINNVFIDKTEDLDIAMY